MKETILEAITAVSILNQEVYESGPENSPVCKLIENSGPIFTIESDGDEARISALGIPIWDSVEDGRMKPDPETDEFSQTIVQFVRLQFVGITEIMHAVGEKIEQTPALAV